MIDVWFEVDGKEVYPDKIADALERTVLKKRGRRGKEQVSPYHMPLPL